MAPVEVARAWAALRVSPTQEGALDLEEVQEELQEERHEVGAQPLYMRLVRIGAAHITLSYHAGNGELPRLIESLLESERSRDDLATPREARPHTTTTTSYHTP